MLVTVVRKPFYRSNILFWVKFSVMLAFSYVRMYIQLYMYYICIYAYILTVCMYHDDLSE